MIASVIRTAVGTLLIGAGVLLAGPKIQVDTETADLGVFKEGKALEATYSFKVKNIGDSILIIKEVKPG